MISPPVGKSGPGTMSSSSSVADVGPVDQRQAGVDDFAEVVRRDVGGHAHGDAAGAVDQQVGDARGQDRRLLLLAVVVVLEVDRVLVEVGHDRHRRPGQAALGVAHCRRRIVVHRAEVALAVDEQQAHGERLGHAHQRVVDREVAVRVVLAHHVADDAGALHVAAVGRVPLFVHREQDAALDGLEAVAHVGQRPADDDAHGVVEVRFLDLVLDRNRTDEAPLIVSRRRGSLVGQIGDGALGCR